MRACIRLIRADSDEAEAYGAALGSGSPTPPGRTLADLRTSLDLTSDLSSAARTSFVSDPTECNAEVAAYLRGEARIPVVLGEGVASASADDRLLALHQIQYDSPEEAERITRASA